MCTYRADWVERLVMGHGAGTPESFEPSEPSMLSQGEAFAATAFCSFGADTVVVATCLLLQALGLLPKDANTMMLLGIGLFCCCFIAFVLFAASFQLNVAFTPVLPALFPGYGLSAVPDVGGSAVAGNIGGWFLIIAAGLAFYSGAALVLNSTYERVVLPMFPRAPVASP